MKKVIIIFSLILSITSVSAQTMEDVARSKVITWYGIDYSEARFENFRAYLNADVVRRNLSKWSLSPLSNSDKKELRKRYDKSILQVDLSTSERRNNRTDYDKHMVSEGYDMDIDTVKKIVSEYDIKGRGYGILYIVEGFQVEGKRAYIWVVYINESDKSVISAKRFIGEAHGDWEKAIYRVIKLSSKYLNSYK